MKKLFFSAAVFGIMNCYRLTFFVFSIKIFTIITLFQGIVFPLHGQALPISIDSRFEDWSSEAIEVADPADDGSGIELLRMAVANDSTRLFIQIEMVQEINLTDDQNLTLYIDTDLNSSTGLSFNGIGAELVVNFGERDVVYRLPSGQGLMSLNDINFRHQPTVTSTVFEMSFDLTAVSNIGFDLFSDEGVSLVWKDETGPAGDALPDEASVFTYLFDKSPVPALEPIPLEKENPATVRLATWNVLQNGIDDIDRKAYFTKILSVVKPDIITFNECWDINPFQVASFMNNAVPLENFENWQTVKVDDGNITASRYPILQSWYILPGQRLTASLIDIPSSISDKDLLVINAHFRCCFNDFDRQREADAFVEFIQDAKTPGGIIDLPENTPFVLSGDLNLVGESQQLTTILSGDVVNTTQFGLGGPMDWDGGDLVDVISTHTDDRLAYTWKNNFSSFPPSRIDFHIISGSAMDVDKSYTVQTESMSPERLEEYGLSPFDATFASDHLPKVTDLLLPMPVATSDIAEDWGLTVFPNPSADNCWVAFSIENKNEIHFTLINSIGEVIKEWRQSYPAGKHQIQVELEDLTTGIYYLKLKTVEKNGSLKIMKK
ncbi:MAG: endonuclease/exonuclease/phosphatase family protein [Bacteroidota bacterium]